MNINDDYTLEEVPIELIERGDPIETTTRDGTPVVWVVDSKKLVHNKGAGEAPKFILQAARETDMYSTGLMASTEGPPGTIIHRAISRR